MNQPLSLRTAKGRLLAEATRALEATGGQSAEEAAAVAKARQVEGSSEDKIIARAAALPSGGPLMAEAGHLWTMLRGLWAILFVAAAFGGAATARTAFTTVDGTTVNFFWGLASLLGLHLLSFVLWLVLLLIPRLSQGGALGRGALWLWRQVAERFGTNRHRMAALQAFGNRYGSGSTGRWLASSLSHGLWVGYLGGATIMVLALLSARRYTFVWETTILDVGAYTSLTQLLTALPGVLGVTVPDVAAVIAAEWPGSPDVADQTLWSSLLVAALLLYGLAPRAISLLITTGLCRRDAKRTALDLTNPYYAELVVRLTPTVTATTIVNGDDGQPATLGALLDLQELPPHPPAGPVYVLGWELDTPPIGWPPPGMGPPTVDLGLRESRGELDRAVETISAGQTPSRLIVVADLRQTPDRGVTAVLGSLVHAAKGRVVLMLTGAGAMRDRTATQSAARDRLADWVAAALAAGIAADHIVALDLDDSTGNVRSRLAKLTGGQV